MISKLFILSIVLITLTPIFVQGQTLQEKEVFSTEQLWLGYFNQTRITPKWGTWTDFHLRRTENFVDRWLLGIARVGLTYYFSDQARFTAGYAFVNHFPAAGNQTSRPEHRPWQQLQWFNKYSRFSTMQYLRFEQRFRRQIANDELQEGYNFNYRLRYNFMITVPLKGKEIVPKTPFLVLNDELHINMGREILYNYFDHNRLFAGIGYQFLPQLNVQVGYMNGFYQLPQGNRFMAVHALRFFVFHNLDFRSK